MDNAANVTSLLEAGLKVCGVRGRAIASNLANLDTPGYRRYEVNFKKLLSDAMSASDPRELEVELLQPRNTEVRNNGNDVDMDIEVGDLVRNGAMSKTYMRIMAAQYRQMEMAMRSS